MTRGERVIAFIERYCIVPEGKLIGQPMRLDPFQKEFILAVYDNPAGTDMAILSIARKNGKTGLIAGILLAHLVGPEAVQNTQIVSGALSREQAAIVFNLAVKMVNLNPKLQEIVHITPSGKKLIGLPCNVEYKALSAEGKTTHGLSPILAILDETGQVRGPQDDFIDAITTAQGAHENPLLIVISTQAANDADLLSIWIDDAVKSKDPHIVCHVYEAPKDSTFGLFVFAGNKPSTEIFEGKNVCLEFEPIPVLQNQSYGLAPEFLIEAGDKTKWKIFEQKILPYFIFLEFFDIDYSDEIRKRFMRGQTVQ